MYLFYKYFQIFRSIFFWIQNNPSGAGAYPFFDLASVEHQQAALQVAQNATTQATQQAVPRNDSCFIPLPSQISSSNRFFLFVLHHITSSPNRRSSFIKLPIPHCVVCFQPNRIFFYFPEKVWTSKKSSAPPEDSPDDLPLTHFFELATFGYQQAALPTKSRSAQATQQAIPRCGNCFEMVHAIFFGRGLQFCLFIIFLFD